MLDLFAGTGALGIEALSRGADHVVFMDHSKAALSVIKRNIESCRLEKVSTLIKWDIRNNLYPLRSIPKQFDLVFMDPPYNHNLIKPALYHLHQSSRLKSGCRIVVEHSILEPVPKDSAIYTYDDQRTYGNTVVSFLTYHERCFQSE